MQAGFRPHNSATELIGLLLWLMAALPPPKNLPGLNPLVGGALVLAIVAAVAIPAVLYLPSLPFGAGAFGMGDVKFLAGMGLMLGGDRALSGTLFGLVLAGVVLLVLLLTRRIGRKSFIPFGPFLIIGALWAVLVRG